MNSSLISDIARAEEMSSLDSLPPPEDIVADKNLYGQCHSTLCIALTTIPMSLCIAEIIIGNALVIFAILTQRALRTPSNIIILSLAIADFSVGVFIMPFNIADMIVGWRFGKVLCRIWLTLDVTLCSTSILHISAIAVDRFRSINEGVAYAQSRTIKMTMIVCGALWLIALWIASAPVLGWNDWEEVDDNAEVMECYLTRNLGYIIHSASGAFFIPAAIMVGLYFRIFLLIRNKLRERAKIACIARGKDEAEALEQEHSSGDLLNDPDASTSTDSTKESLQSQSTSNGKKTSFDASSASCTTEDGKTRKKHSEQIETILKNKIRFSLTKERKAAKTLGVIMGAFVLCWTPFTLVYLTSGIIVEIWPESEGVPFWLFQLVTWIGYINAGFNPWIYSVYSPEFRRAFNIIFNRVKCKK